MASAEPWPSGSLYHPTQDSQQLLNSTLPSRATPLWTLSDRLPEGLTCWPRPPVPPPILRLISSWPAHSLAVWQVSYQLQSPSPETQPSAFTCRTVTRLQPIITTCRALWTGSRKCLWSKSPSAFLFFLLGKIPVLLEMAGFPAEDSIPSLPCRQKVPRGAAPQQDRSGAEERDKFCKDTPCCHSQAS